MKKGFGNISNGRHLFPDDGEEFKVMVLLVSVILEVLLPPRAGSCVLCVWCYGSSVGVSAIKSWM